jgi:DNA-binding CsgD family transcriptional regulator
MEPIAREQIMARYQAHAQRFDALARRAASHSPPGNVVPAADEDGQLTARELEVIEWAANGLTDAEIGARLFLAPFTGKVKSGRMLYDRLGTLGQEGIINLADFAPQPVGA